MHPPKLSYAKKKLGTLSLHYFFYKDFHQHLIQLLSATYHGGSSWLFSFRSINRKWICFHLSCVFRLVRMKIRIYQGLSVMWLSV